MAAGFVTKTIGDGAGGTISVRFWSPDTSAGTPVLYPVGQQVDNADGLVFGEVSATPTANTVLGRLKDAVDGITSMLAALLDVPSFLPPTPIGTGDDFTRTAIDFTANTDQTPIAAVSGQKVRVYGLELDFSGACSLEIWDGPSASGTKKRTLQIPSAGTYTIPFNERSPKLRSSAGNAIILKCSSNTVHVTGEMESTQAA